jgi:hypothetical protein
MQHRLTRAVPLSCRSFSHAVAPAAAGAPGIAQYLRGIAAWHEGSQPRTADYFDVGAVYRMCGQAKLPAVQVRLVAVRPSLILGSG